MFRRSLVSLAHPRLAPALAGLLASALGAGCGTDARSAQGGASGTAAPAPLAVATGAIEINDVPRYLTLTGSIQADRQSEVAANVSGRVTATYVERGMPVKQGQVLAVVDSKAASLQAAAAAAQSDAAQTQVQLAQQECQRADTLFAQGALARAEHDRLKAQCTAQLYQANAAQANADLAGKLAGDTVIRAPFSGRVGERYVNIGEYVTPPSRVASVYGVDPVRISISVPEPAVALVQQGQDLGIEVAAYPGRVFPATVRFVSPALRPTTRDLIVEAEARNPDGALRPGMFATVRLTVGDEKLPTVPRAAIKSDGTVRRMFMVRDGAAVEMVVRTGVEKDGRVAVLEPVNAGDVVVVDPPPGLRDGTTVETGGPSAALPSDADPPAVADPSAPGAAPRAVQ